jgi:hypothetical protein
MYISWQPKSCKVDADIGEKVYADSGAWKIYNGRQKSIEDGQSSRERKVYANEYEVEDVE